jgi:ABC-2 type transport system ATP-binding protein
VENLSFLGELYAMERRDVAKRTEELLKTVTLFDKKDVPCRGFSGGMKQRLSVAAGLLHEPEILFMDEPTTGLDPQSRIALRDLTTRLNKSGITVVYTTHDMEEADKLCDRVAIMDHGKVITEGSPEQLKDKYGSGHKIRLELMEKPTEALVHALKRQFPSTKVTTQGEFVELHSQTIGGALVYKVSEYLSKHKVQIQELLVQEPSLEEVFINLTDSKLRD